MAEISEENLRTLKGAGRSAAVAMSAIGAATGLVVGLSNSPVVAVALPLILGLVAGGSGIWMLRVDPNNNGNIHALRLGMYGVTLFAILFVFGIACGIYTRSSGSMWYDLALIDASDAKPINFDDPELSYDEIMAAMALRVQLVGLGASQVEQEKLLASFFKRAVQNNSSEHRPEAGQNCETLATSIDATVAALLVAPVSNDVNAGEIQNLLQMAEALKSLSVTANTCALANVSASKSEALSKQILDETRELLATSLFDRAIAEAEDSPWRALSAFPDGPKTVANLVVLTLEEPLTTKPTASNIPEFREIWEMINDQQATFQENPSSPNAIGRGLASNEDPLGIIFNQVDG